MIRRTRRSSFSPPPVIQNRRAPLTVLENVAPVRKKQLHVHLPPLAPPKEMFCLFAEDLDSGYKKQILENLYSRQVQHDTLLEIVQSGVTTQMRSQLIEWMFALCCHFKTSRDIIFIAVSILDRSLCKLRSDKEKFQLLGATCIHIAVKLQGTHVIEIKELMKECGHAYTGIDFLQCENDILQALDYDLTTPTLADFISIHETIMNTYSPFNNLVWSLANLQIQFSSFLRFKASTVSTSILIYSVYCFNEPINQPCLISLAQKEDWNELFRCIEELVRVLMEIVGKTKHTILEKIRPLDFRKMKQSIGVPSIISFEEFFQLYPKLKLF